MYGKIVHEVAEIMCEKAEDMILQRMDRGDDPMLLLRGSLMYALISSEMSAGATREDVLSFVGKLYDILDDRSLKN